MNTIKTTLLILVFTFSCQVSSNAKKPLNEIKPIFKQIQRLMNGTPELKIYDEIVVTVKFRLNKNHKITIISDDSDSYDITKLIKRTLNHKQLVTMRPSVNKIYSVPIRFLATAD